MDEEYYLTEEQRIRLEIEKEEKKKLKKEAGRRWRWLRGAAIAGLILLVVIFLLIRQWEKSQDVHRKPVIYLYPEETAEVFVRLELDGELTTTYPKYQNGWHVTAEPDGTLTDADGMTYNYLYWEGKSAVEYDMSAGFCVKGCDTAEFLEKALSELGLTRREANEFIVYWLPLMENNNYNVISFQTEAYAESAKLIVSPMPDAVIRVYMAWYGSDKPVKLQNQDLSSMERKGFTVVEWGGSEIHPR